MKVYIASKYLEHKDINLKIYNSLLAENIDVFLPKSINVDAVTSEEMHYVAEVCYNEIEKCDIMVIVTPFGKSVSSEIGYNIALKRLQHNRKLILYNPTSLSDKKLEKEAMIIPYIDVEINNIENLVNYIKNIEESNSK